MQSFLTNISTVYVCPKCKRSETRYLSNKWVDSLASFIRTNGLYLTCNWCGPATKLDIISATFHAVRKELFKCE